MITPQMSSPEVETLMRRLDRLERGLRRWRIVGGVAWTALAASIALMYVLTFHPVDNADMFAVGADDLHVLLDVPRAGHGCLHQPPMRSKKPAWGGEVPETWCHLRKRLTALRLWCS